MSRARVLLASTLLIASAAAFAEPLPPTPSASPAASSADVEQRLRYRVVIDAPPPLRDAIAASVDLIRWQDYEEMGASLFDALVRQAPDQAKEAAATEGFFSANVDVSVDRASTPWQVKVSVAPGPQARVQRASIDVQGAATTDDAGRAAIAEVKRAWPLNEGAPFRQAAWISAKAQAVEEVAGSGFAAAKLLSSEALVDPAANTVDVQVTIDSGPVFRLGDLEIEGLSRYPAELVRNYRTRRPGDRYSIAELDQFVRRLNGSGYFASVHAAIDTDPAKAADAPVHVAVIEAPTKKLEAGLGFSTDTAFRGNVSYRDVDVNHHALQMYVDARVESKLQNASLRFVQPPAANGWSPSVFARLEQTDISGLVTKTAVAGARMTSLDERNQWQYGAAFYTDLQEPTGFANEDARALYVDVERAWRRVDDLVAPTRGWIALAQAGVGIPGASTRQFGRVIVRYAMWQPISSLWSFTARADAGAVLAASRNDIPSVLLFRTGGDVSVRGYAFQSLGIKQGDVVLPARYYFATSVEATRWINDLWGVATFVDAGDAFDATSDMKVALGYGVGVRVRTPIGPFRLDLAYGQESRQVRLHFSVGVAF
jgi:translocation and assembly module TamA